MHRAVCPKYNVYEIRELFCLLNCSVFGCFLFWIVVYNFYNFQFNKRHDLTANLAYVNMSVIPHHLVIACIACCWSHIWAKLQALSSELGALNTEHCHVHLTFTKLFDTVVFGRSFNFENVCNCSNCSNLFHFWMILDSMENETKPCISTYNESKLIADLGEWQQLRGKPPKTFLNHQK